MDQLKRSLSKTACYSSCFFFFPTAGDAETFLEDKSSEVVLILFSLLSQSKTNEILGPM